MAHRPARRGPQIPEPTVFQGHTVSRTSSSRAAASAGFSAACSEETTRDEEERSSARSRHRPSGLQESSRGLLAHVTSSGSRSAMASRPGAKVLLIDEPVAGMSPDRDGSHRAALRSLAEMRTVIVVEHDMTSSAASPKTSPSCTKERCSPRQDGPGGKRIHA